MGSQDASTGLNFLKQLLIGDLSFLIVVQRGIVVDSDLFPTTGLNVTIDSVKTSIELSALEPGIPNFPLIGNRVWRGVMEDFGIREVPVQLRCEMTPIFGRVL